MIKNVIGILLGLFGVLLLFSANNRRSLIMGYNFIHVILPIVGLIMIALSVKLINLKKIADSSLGKLSFKMKHVIIFLILIIIVMVLLVLIMANHFISSPEI